MWFKAASFTDIWPWRGADACMEKLIQPGGRRRRACDVIPVTVERVGTRQG